MNNLLVANNLDVLVNMSDESVDLICTDPPFNTGRIQNRALLSWRQPSGVTYQDDFLETGDYTNDKSKWFDAVEAFHKKYEDDEFYFLHHFCSPKELFYFMQMIPTVRELYRVLKWGGGFYWHIDYRTTHVWRIILNKIFKDKGAFNSEIIWHYPNKIPMPCTKRRFTVNHNTILFYTKYVQHNDEALHNLKLECEKGTLMRQRTVWTIEFVKSKERVDYPTQKPLALYARMIRSSSAENDLVLDPFCGSGTTIIAADMLNRRYIGIDEKPEAIELCKERLNLQQIKMF